MERHLTVSPLSVILLIGALIAGFLTIATVQTGNVQSKPQSTVQQHLESKKIAIIGDSLTSQAGVGIMNIETSLQKAGFASANWYIYGVDGKQILAADKYGTTTLENIEQARKKLGSVDAWLIALGTNDRAKRPDEVASEVQTVMKKIGFEDVVWVNVTSRDQSYPTNATTNAAIQKALSKYKYASYVDFDSYVHKTGRHNDWWKPKAAEDPIHMTEEGYAVRNAYYVQQLKLALADG